MELLIPCFLFLTISGFVSATQVVNGTFGRSIYFYESLSNQDLSLQWQFNRILVASRFPGFPPGCVPEYEDRCHLYDNGTLRLGNLTSADEGIYNFNAVQPPSTPVRQASYELMVYPVLSVPVLSSNGTNERLIGGTYVSLHCDAGNQIVTNYTFYHDGKNICSEPHVSCKDAYLHFQPITGNDSGYYTCTIQNPVSFNTSNTLQLSVTDPVSDVTLTSNITGLVWPGLDSVSLTCSARGTNISYSWKLQGVSLPLDPQYHLTENNRVLTINHVSDKENGTFTCIASNWINNGTSNGVNLILASGVSEVTLTSNATESYIWDGEESVSLHCSAYGSNITFHWMLNGAPLPQDPRYHRSESDFPPHADLLISPVSRNDNGNFTCDASNRVSNKTSNALSLNLAWNPKGNIDCTVEPVGINFFLGCSWPGGHPAANVSLNFNAEKVIGTNGVTVEVNKTDIKGSNFTCHGDQLGKRSQCELNLVDPEAPSHNNDTISKAKVGETLILTVILKPGLPANFTWYRLNPNPIPIQTIRKPLVDSTNSSSSLWISNVALGDAGNYECIAKNVIGTQGFLFTVDVAVDMVKGGFDGGAIAGIVIGVLVLITLIGILIFFLTKKKKHNGDNKGINGPEAQLEASVHNSTVQKENGDVKETSMANSQQEDMDDVKYAVIKFPNNNSTKATVPPPVETEYSTIKTSIKQ